MRKSFSKSKGALPHKFGALFGLGFELAIAVGLGVAVGYFLDQKSNSSPLFLILGLFIGAIAGFINVYRTVYPNQRRKDVKSDDAHKEPNS